MKRINVKLTESEHKALKVEMAKKGLTISQWIRAMIAKMMGKPG